jgi:uncharacterized membrane protein
LGWGLFNLIEGIIDHQIIGLHHVVERAVGNVQIFWDFVFLTSGVALVALGIWQIRQGRRALSSQSNSFIKNKDRNLAS